MCTEPPLCMNCVWTSFTINYLFTINLIFTIVVLIALFELLQYS